MFDPRIRHVGVTVFNDEGALRPEEILDSQPGRRQELEMPADFRGAPVERRVQDAGAEIQERHKASTGVEVESEKQRRAEQMAAGVDGTAQNALVDDLEAAERSVLEVADDEACLRLEDQHVDMRDVARDGVFDAVAHLHTEIPSAAVRPVGCGVGSLTRTRLGPGRLRFRGLGKNVGAGEENTNQRRAVRDNGKSALEDLHQAR